MGGDSGPCLPNPTGVTNCPQRLSAVPRFYFELWKLKSITKPSWSLSARSSLHKSCQQALVHGQRSVACPWYLAASTSSRGGVAVDAHITNGTATLDMHPPRLSGLSSCSTVLKPFFITVPKRQSLTISKRLTVVDHKPLQSAASTSDDVERDHLSCRLESITVVLLRLYNLTGGPSTSRRRNLAVP